MAKTHTKTRLVKNHTGKEPAGAKYAALETLMWGMHGEIEAGEEIPPFPLPAGDWFVDEDGALWRQSEFVAAPERWPDSFPDREDLVARGLAVRTDRKGRKAAAA